MSIAKSGDMTGPFSVTVSLSPFRAQELCESRGGHPGLSSLYLIVSVDVKQHWSWAHLSHPGFRYSMPALQSCFPCRSSLPCLPPSLGRCRGQWRGAGVAHPLSPAAHLQQRWHFCCCLEHCNTESKHKGVNLCLKDVTQTQQQSLELPTVALGDIQDVPLVESTCLVFTHVPSASYHRKLRSLLLCLCDIFRALINSLVCWFCNGCSGLCSVSDWHRKISLLDFDLTQFSVQQ